MKKKYIIIIVLICFIILFTGPYKYNNIKTVEYVRKHYESHSRCMCAWYCMKAIRNGGCNYCYIFPGYAYNKILPKLGFKEVSTKEYIPQLGDISVLPKNPSSGFGHIAIYDGSNWISDFKQKSIFPGKGYIISGEYQIFRIEDGWHWAFLYFSIDDIHGYVESLVSGYRKINL